MASESTIRPQSSVSDARLWFAVAMGFFAWHLAGTAGMFITWRAGLHNEAYGNAVSVPWAYAAAFASIGFLILLTVIAGVMGVRDWHRLSNEGHIWEGEGRGRKDFMALIGVFISFTLGIGVVWELIAHFILQYCLRMR
jgi:hypothetical protein